MTVSLHNRRKLEMAIRHLLDSTVTPPDTKLTWKNVAAVAAVSKATADRAVDLRDEFRRQIEERMPTPTTRPQPGSRSRGDADEELARLRREHAELKQSTKVLHSVILALVQENQRLARRSRRDRQRRSSHRPRQAAETEALMDGDDVKTDGSVWPSQAHLWLHVHVG